MLKRRGSGSHQLDHIVRIDERSNNVSHPHIIATVGLPGRGKTFIARKLARYLQWLGIKARVFNVGEYRRQATAQKDYDFFCVDNKEAFAIRQMCAKEALEDVIAFIESGGEVAIFDATNTTRERRAMIYKRIVEEKNYKLFFIESICDDEEIIENNIKEVKVTSPDYTQTSQEEAYQDFIRRIETYKNIYETLDQVKESNYSFMKIFNAGERILVHKHEGHLQARIVYYLMNTHLAPRTIYLTRHGESLANLEGRIGGDSDLSEHGVEFSKMLAQYIKEQNIEKLRVWTSWAKRAIQTANFIKDAPQEHWKALNELDAGIFEGMTYSEISQNFPQEFVARDQNKFSYRSPRGESYEDVIGRLEPVIMELNRQKNILVIAHQAVLRCILAYFLNKNSDELPYLEVPLHCIIKLTPVAYGCRVEYEKLEIPAVDTHRPKPPLPGLLQDKFKDNSGHLNGENGSEIHDTGKTCSNGYHYTNGHENGHLILLNGEKIDC